MFRLIQKFLKTITHHGSAPPQKRCRLHALWVGVTEHGPAILLDIELTTGKQPLLIKQMSVRLKHQETPQSQRFDALLCSPPQNQDLLFSRFQPISLISVTLLHPFRGLVLFVDRERFSIIAPIIMEGRQHLRTRPPADRRQTSGEQNTVLSDDPAVQQLIQRLETSSFWPTGAYTLSLTLETEDGTTLQHKRSFSLSPTQAQQIRELFPALILSLNDPSQRLSLAHIPL